MVGGHFGPLGPNAMKVGRESVPESATIHDQPMVDEIVIKRIVSKNQSNVIGLEHVFSKCIESFELYFRFRFPKEIKSFITLADYFAVCR